MFIMIEGVDGSGKTTMSKRLAAKIGAELREFPDRTTPTGEVIDLLLRGKVRVANERGEICALCEMGGTGDDAHAVGTKHVNAIVHQALQVANKLEAMPWLTARLRAGADVVFSRWVPSAIAYGRHDGCDPTWTEIINETLLEPDLGLLLDVPVGVAMVRKGKDVEAYETAARIGAARQNYLDLWLEKRAHGNGNWIVIDATRGEDTVFEEVCSWYEARRMKSMRG